MGLGAAFVIDFTERFRRIAEGLGILRLSSGDEISVQIPAEAQIISALAFQSSDSTPSIYSATSW
jgi:hypothetical protein